MSVRASFAGWSAEAGPARELRPTLQGRGVEGQTKGGVLNVGTLDNLARGQQKRCSDTEV